MSILIVEDDPVSATIIATSLERRNFATLRAATANEARQMLEEDTAVQLLGAARLESSLQRIHSDAAVFSDGAIAQRIILPELRLLRSALQQELQQG